MSHFLLLLLRLLFFSISKTKRIILFLLSTFLRKTREKRKCIYYRVWNVSSGNFGVMRMTYIQSKYTWIWAVEVLSFSPTCSLYFKSVFNGMIEWKCFFLLLFRRSPIGKVMLSDGKVKHELSEATDNCWFTYWVGMSERKRCIQFSNSEDAPKREMTNTVIELFALYLFDDDASISYANGGYLSPFCFQALPLSFTVDRYCNFLVSVGLRFASMHLSCDLH